MRGKGRTTCNLCQPVFKFNILFYILSGSYRSGLCSKTFLVKSRRRTHSAKPPILLSDLSYVCYLPLVFTLSREITGIGWCVTCFSGVYRGVLCFYFFLTLPYFFFVPSLVHLFIVFIRWRGCSPVCTGAHRQYPKIQPRLRFSERVLRILGRWK